ncbi:TPA: cellulase family glycosylhydrolase [Klebsiella oxytoca]|nr:cellulase family glycosylhydrolase [Klebsiella oxytoca]HEJ8978008.1 cellulase family glycosylhydrolase [Klebsiella oxytoca]
MRVYIKIFIFLLLMPIYNANAFYVGVGAHPNGFTGSAIDFLNLLKKYHINAIRVDYPWSDVELKKNVFTAPVNNTENILSIAKQNDVEPIVILDYGNKLYGIKKPTTDEDIDKFTRYAIWTVEHFKGKVKIFEIWNEWSNRKNKNANSDESALQYVKLVAKVSKAIKLVDPSIIVIAGSINPMDYIDLAWGRKLVKLGLLDYIDGMSLHPYIYGSKRAAQPIRNIKYLELINKEFMKLSGRKDFIDLYITEIGFPTSENYTVFTEKDVAEYAKNYILEGSKVDYIKGIWWYDLINDGNNKKNREHNFGILNRNLSEKDVSQAIKNASESIK